MAIRADIETAEGSFVVEFSEHGLKRLHFPGMKTAKELPAQRPMSFDSQLQHWLKLTESALTDILSGRQPKTLPPLDWSGHTEFQQKVWQALLRIQPGQTKTYSQFARDLGKPLAARATGGACGANPIPVLVPCHRVVAANGGLGGFSCGLDWKRRLLALEGIK